MALLFIVNFCQLISFCQDEFLNRKNVSCYQGMLIVLYIYNSNVITCPAYTYLSAPSEFSCVDLSRYFVSFHFQNMAQGKPGNCLSVFQIAAMSKKFVSEFVKYSEFVSLMQSIFDNIVMITQQLNLCCHSIRYCDVNHIV